MVKMRVPCVHYTLTHGGLVPRAPSRGWKYANCWRVWGEWKGALLNATLRLLTLENLDVYCSLIFSNCKTKHIYVTSLHTFISYTHLSISKVTSICFFCHFQKIPIHRFQGFHIIYSYLFLFIVSLHSLLSFSPATSEEKLLIRRVFKMEKRHQYALSHGSTNCTFQGPVASRGFTKSSTPKGCKLCPALKCKNVAGAHRNRSHFPSQWGSAHSSPMRLVAYPATLRYAQGTICTVVSDFLQ